MMERAAKWKLKFGPEVGVFTCGLLLKSPLCSFLHKNFGNWVNPYFWTLKNWPEDRIHKRNLHIKQHRSPLYGGHGLVNLRQCLRTSIPLIKK